MLINLLCCYIGTILGIGLSVYMIEEKHSKGEWLSLIIWPLIPVIMKIKDKLKRKK